MLWRKDSNIKVEHIYYYIEGRPERLSVSYIIGTNEYSHDVIKLAFAVNGRGDNFSRKTGRNISMGRLMCLLDRGYHNFAHIIILNDNELNGKPIFDIIRDYFEELSEDNYFNISTLNGGINLY